MPGRGSFGLPQMNPVLLSLIVITISQPADRVFTITVVDEQSGRGVPLVELRTDNEIKYYTDSNGVVAFREPGLMDQDVFFLSPDMATSFRKTVSVTAEKSSALPGAARRQ